MKKYDNFCSALDNLSDIYKYEEPYDNVVLTGLTHLFGICFEQSWKAIKELLQYNGISETGSPRQILKSAYQAGLINDENIWLSVLLARNNIAHSYNRDVALDIVKNTKELYYDMFCDLKREMKNWIPGDDIL